MAGADAAPILLAHSSLEVQTAIREALHPREVLVVHDAFAAAAEVARAAFGAIVLEHPLLGMDAPFLAGWLRDCGASAPFVVIADGLPQVERFQLSLSVGGGAAVVGSADAAEIRVALKLVESAGPATAGGVPGSHGTAATPAFGVMSDGEEPAEAAGGREPLDVAPAFDPVREAEMYAVTSEDAPDPAPADEPPLEEAYATADVVELAAEPYEGTPVEDPSAGEEAIVMDVDDGVVGDALAGEPMQETVVAEEAPPAIEAPRLPLPPPGVRLALKADDASFSRWMSLDLPPKLIGLLDGTRDAAAVIAEAAAAPDEIEAYLGQLLDAGCLDTDGGADVTAATSVLPVAPSAAPRWKPPLPDAPAVDEGTFETTPAPELLLRLARDATTGSLYVETDGWTMSIHLEEGRPVRASGGPEGLRFGELLAQLGYLKPAALGQLLADQRQHPSVPLGDLAIRQGLITARHVLEALTVQIDRNVHLVVGLTGGHYRVYHHEVQGVISEPTAMPRLVAEGLAENETRRFQLVAGFLARHAQSGITAKPHAGTLLSEFRFGARVQRLIRSMDGTSITDVLHGSPIPRAEAEVAIYLLWAVGAADLGKAKTAAPPPESPAHVAPSAPRVEYLPTRTVAPPPRPMTPAAPPTAPSRTPLPAASRSPHADPTPLSSSGVRREQQIQEKLELAARAMESKVYGTAVDLLSSARALDPKNPQVLAALGWAVFRGQPGSGKAREQARHYLSEALAIDSGNVQALVPLGKIERLDGEFDKAREIFERVLEADPENADAKHEIDTLDRLGGKDKEASSDTDSSSSFLGLLFRRKKS